MDNINFINRIKSMVGEKGINIKELNDETINILFKNGLLNNAYDIFLLKKEELYKIDGFTKEYVDELIKSINKTKNCSFEKFIYACSIPKVTEKEAIVIAHTFLNFTDLVIDVNNNDCDRLKRIDGMSEEIVESIKRNKVLLVNLFMYVNPISIDEKNTNIKRYKFSITGVLNKDTSYYEEMIKEANCIVVDNVTKDVDYLVFGDLANAIKMMDAKKYNTRLISERQLVDILKEIKENNKMKN
ncbi:BRCT domain-containing protein [Clostridium botulinum]|uniref:BRCT domain-containing protein n=2 Tax=Clostridium botulinum TaxID=1491 RepID=A0A6G4CUM6_CLOBO|nr:BRCT domain-containing protein [Clostridium botulinum]NFA01550.1 BRCT domain-containing protein [Clostridium botulinum]NFA33320.1 BRCT domain-containing protein [Clostridium botulinum]NFA87240.1 BRCT domain-containing protein [Clostridium botulinum]NFB08209.1 BRCT domain-containing protein [Clostridium botulinum]